MKKNYQMGRKMYSFFETYMIEVDAFRVIPLVKKASKKEIISDKFRERIMLAVTTVNGCPACSYAHTKYALESGISDEEINAILNSDPDAQTKFCADEEAVGLSFAQHFADMRTHPDKKAWESVVARYGQEKALVILAYIRIITMGNALGVRYSGIVDPLKGRETDERTHFITSILFLLLMVIATPFAALQALFENIFRARYITFS